MLTEQLQMSDGKIATAYTILPIMDLRRFKHIFSQDNIYSEVNSESKR